MSEETVTRPTEDLQVPNLNEACDRLVQLGWRDGYAQALRELSAMIATTDDAFTVMAKIGELAEKLVAVKP